MLKQIQASCIYDTANVPKALSAITCATLIIRNLSYHYTLYTPTKVIQAFFRVCDQIVCITHVCDTENGTTFSVFTGHIRLNQ